MRLIEILKVLFFLSLDWGIENWCHNRRVRRIDVLQEVVSLDLLWLQLINVCLTARSEEIVTHSLVLFLR